MQQVYQSSRAPEKEKTEEKKLKKKRHPSQPSFDYVEESPIDVKSSDAEVLGDEVKAEHDEVKPKRNLSPRQRFKSVKSFKDMDVDERLNYLIPFIGKQAPFVCTFSLKEGRSFKGIVTKNEDPSFIVLTTTGTEEKINRNDLLSIHIN
ncbi:hypothetical protein KP78_20610 [Jeotgalibacillus soli]|uniref:Spore coat protein CotO n=2 Tax=Jeotgalibacillus soli TaxID=889306 RepID=A0A0C2V9S8_9BACL|nr:hypothetical protein KP78_20610 [Jeotgalibacillus soli]